MPKLLLPILMSLAIALATANELPDPIFEDHFELRENVTAWNESTCQYDDDGTSHGTGELAVNSIVLAQDSDPNDNIDDGTTVYYPTLLESSGCTFKLIGWGNGTSGSGGAHYPDYFSHLASHGFVVAVAHTNFAAAADQPLLTSIGLVIASNDDPSSVLHKKIDLAFGLMGKSQGAFAVARELADPNATAGVLIAAGSSEENALSKPGLFITGDHDFAQPSVINGFDLATGEAIFAQATQAPNPIGNPAAGHLDLDTRLGAIELSTSFMRCHLRDDSNTCDYITCGSCQTEPWSGFKTKNIPVELAIEESDSNADRKS